jgi:hypothetical protein
MEGLTFDLSQGGVRPLNQHLHGPASELSGQHIVVTNPDGAHNIAVGMDAAVKVTIEGHAGYYAAGMNKLADVTINGSASTGVAENMMSGKCAREGLCLEQRWCLGPWRPADHRWRRGPALRHLAQGWRHRGGRLGGQLLGFHGASRSHGDLRQRRRCAG